MQIEFNATQKEMPNVLFVVGLDIAQMVVRIFELPLDKKMWTIRVIGLFVSFEHGLVVIACEGRSGYVVSPDHAPHDPFLHVRPTHARRRSDSGGIRCDTTRSATRLGLICLARRRVGARSPAAYGPDGIRRSAT